MRVVGARRDGLDAESGTEVALRHPGRPRNRTSRMPAPAIITAWM
jgi:hypothetical protein